MKLIHPSWVGVKLCCTGIITILGLFFCPLSAATAGEQGRLVVLRDTGHTRGEFPVLAPHPDEGDVVRILTSGFSGRLLRLPVRGAGVVAEIRRPLPRLPLAQRPAWQRGLRREAGAGAALHRGGRSEPLLSMGT